MRSNRPAAAVSLGLAAIVMGIAGLAWACTPQATISLAPRSARAGDQVTVNGTRFAEGPVEIRWNDAAGPVLAVASGPEFSVQIQAPADAADGVYFIVAADAASSGEAFTNRVSDALEISGRPLTAKTSPGAADLWTGFADGGVSQGLEPAAAEAPAAPAGLSAGIALSAAAATAMVAVIAGRARTSRSRRRA